MQGLLSTAPPSADWELYGPNGVLGDIHRRFNDWSDRCSLASPGGAAAGQAFLEVFCRRLDEVKEAVPALYRVLGDLGTARAVAQELAAMAAECFKPPRGPPAGTSRAARSRSLSPESAPWQVHAVVPPRGEDGAEHQLDRGSPREKCLGRTYTGQRVVLG